MDSKKVLAELLKASSKWIDPNNPTSNNQVSESLRKFKHLFESEQGSDRRESTQKTTTNTTSQSQKPQGVVEDLLTDIFTSVKTANNQTIAKGALSAGALALLLGTEAGRKLGGSALKIGGLAALGGLAFKAVDQFSGRGETQDSKTDAGSQHNTSATEQENDEPDKDTRNMILLKAILAAVKADGHISEQERHAMIEQIRKLDVGTDVEDFLLRELYAPVDAQQVAAHAHSPKMAAEIYLVSLMVIDINQPTERAYMNQLAQDLGLSEALASHLEKQAEQQVKDHTI